MSASKAAYLQARDYFLDEREDLRNFAAQVLDALYEDGLGKSASELDAKFREYFEGIIDDAADIDRTAKQEARDEYDEDRDEHEVGGIGA